MESLRVLNHGLQKFLDQGDARVKDWPMMQTPFPGMAMIVAYLYFVTVAGPRYMKNKPAYEIRLPMVVYNFGMVAYSLWIFLELGYYTWFNDYKDICQPVDYSNNYRAVRIAEMGWWFYISKFVEFLDTIFFVLRKKDRQISFLHVFHHSLVPFSLWFGIKYAPGGYNSMFPLLNSFVHTIMYAYYGLTALGYKTSMFWKMSITYIQMFQFVIVTTYAILLHTNKCSVSKAFIAMNILHAMLFFVLFLNFMLRNYTSKAKSKVA